MTQSTYVNELKAERDAALERAAVLAVELEKATKRSRKLSKRERRKLERLLAADNNEIKLRFYRHTLALVERYLALSALSSVARLRAGLTHTIDSANPIRDAIYQPPPPR